MKKTTSQLLGVCLDSTSILFTYSSYTSLWPSFIHQLKNLPVTGSSDRGHSGGSDWICRILYRREHYCCWKFIWQVVCLCNFHFADLTKNWSVIYMRFFLIVRWFFFIHIVGSHENLNGCKEFRLLMDILFLVCDTIISPTHEHLGLWLQAFCGPGLSDRGKASWWCKNDSRTVIHES